jgi:hypothetical protein
VPTSLPSSPIAENDVRFAAVIPAGPNASIDYIRDTIDSIRFYTMPQRKVIVMDDSACKRFDALNRYHGDVMTLDTPRNLGRYWGMYASLSQGFKYAADHFPNLQSVLRLDDDAMVIGPGVCEQSIAFFKQHPNIGLMSQYWYTAHNEWIDPWYPKRELTREMDKGRLKGDSRDRCLAFRRLVAAATKHGYQLGESCFGGAYFISPSCIRALDKAGYLPIEAIKGAYIEEDHIFSLLIRSLGIELGDFTTGDLPMAQNLLDLPMSPQELLDRGKKVVHSVRAWADIEQDAIRLFFRQKRAADGRMKGVT